MILRVSSRIWVALDEIMRTLLLFYVVGSLFLIGLSLPLIGQKIRPNPFYGFRLTPVFNDERIWYATNKYAAKWLAAGGVSVLLTAIGLYFVPGLSVDFYALACLGVLIGVLVPGFISSYRYARSMAEEQK